MEKVISNHKNFVGIKIGGGGDFFLSSGGLGWGEDITREDITEKLGKFAIPDSIWGNFVKKQLPDNFVVGGGAA